MEIDAKGPTRGLSLHYNLNTILLENFFVTERSPLSQYKCIGSEETGYLTNIYGPQLI
jgi:hypothetical protein